MVSSWILIRVPGVLDKKFHSHNTLFSYCFGHPGERIVMGWNEAGALYPHFSKILCHVQMKSQTQDKEIRRYLCYVTNQCTVLLYR